jgi:DNA-binding NarL/FixJ family response regulator
VVRGLNPASAPVLNPTTESTRAKPRTTAEKNRFRDTRPAAVTTSVARAVEAFLLARTYPAGLSVREVEVLRLVAEGLTNPQIGARLFLSPRTVEHHLHAIFNKTGVSSRAAAARWAAEHPLS